MDIAGHIANLFLLTFLVLLIAFSPVIIMVHMFIMLTSKRPLKNALVLCAAVTLPLIIIAVIGGNYLDSLATFSLGSIAHKIHPPAIIYFLFGVSLWVAGIRRALEYRTRDKSLPVKALHLPSDSLTSLFAFGFIKSLFSITNIFAVLTVVQLTKGNGLGRGVEVAALIWTIFVGLFPLLLALYYRQYHPKRLEKMNQKLTQLLTSNLQLMLIIAIFGLGTYFLVAGLRVR